MKIRKGDKVRVLAGKDRGKEGKVRVLLRTMQATLLSFARRCHPKSSTACPHGPSRRRLSTGGGQGSGWPPALLEWVDRAFGRCQQPQQRQFVDAGLKATVKQAQEVRATAT